MMSDKYRYHGIGSVSSPQSLRKNDCQECAKITGMTFSQKGKNLKCLIFNSQACTQNASIFVCVQS